MSNIVEMKNIRFSWKGQSAFSMELENFTVKKGESLLLLGPSGSGKSTFLSLLCGIITPDSGTVKILGQDLKALGGAGRDHFRSEHFGIIFQMFNLLPYASVIDNVVLPLSFAKQRKKSLMAKGDINTEAIRLLERLGLTHENLNKKTAAQLSVGQQQRVAAARALIGSPEIIVADEPTSSLDRQMQVNFLELLSEEVFKADSNLIMVSHDETLAPNFDHVMNITDMINLHKAAAQ